MFVPNFIFHFPNTVAFVICLFLRGVNLNGLRGSPNIEMDEHTFLVNRERAVDYLCSLDKVFVTNSSFTFIFPYRSFNNIVSRRKEIFETSDTILLC